MLDNATEQHRRTSSTTNQFAPAFHYTELVRARGGQTDGTTEEADIPGGESRQREGVSVRHDAGMHDLVLNKKNRFLLREFSR